MQRWMIACGVAHVPEPLEGLLDLLHRADEDVGEVDDLGGHRLQLVEHDALGGRLDEVHDVVHPADQPVDVVPLDRRDEGLVQRLDAPVGDHVGLVLDLRDPLGLRSDVGARGHQRQELLGPLDRERGVLLEEVEEAGLARQQPSEHDSSTCAALIARFWSKREPGARSSGRARRGRPEHCPDVTGVSSAGKEPRRSTLHPPAGGPGRHGDAAGERARPAEGGRANAARGRVGPPPRSHGPELRPGSLTAAARPRIGKGPGATSRPLHRRCPDRRSCWARWRPSRTPFPAAMASTS